MLRGTLLKLLLSVYIRGYTWPGSHLLTVTSIDFRFQRPGAGELSPGCVPIKYLAVSAIRCTTEYVGVVNPELEY